MGSCCGAPSADGVRYMLDQAQRFAQAGPPVFIRLRNYTTAQEVDPIAQGLGFVVIPTGEPAGTADFRIDPPPTVKQISLRTSAALVQAGLAQNANARSLIISHTWVLAQMQSRGFTDPSQVFFDDTTMGFVIEGQLMSIVNVIEKAVYGDYISWTVTGYSLEKG